MNRCHAADAAAVVPVWFVTCPATIAWWVSPLASAAWACVHHSQVSVAAPAACGPACQLPAASASSCLQLHVLFFHEIRFGMQQLRCSLQEPNSAANLAGKPGHARRQMTACCSGRHGHNNHTESRQYLELVQAHSAFASRAQGSGSETRAGAGGHRLRRSSACARSWYAAGVAARLGSRAASSSRSAAAMGSAVVDCIMRSRACIYQDCAVRQLLEGLSCLSSFHPCRLGIWTLTGSRHTTRLSTRNQPTTAAS